MSCLKEPNDLYDLFCENGYEKSFDDFKTEMDVFLHSDDMSKIINDNFSELSDEALEGIAVGVGLKRAATTGIASLMTASVGAVNEADINQVVQSVDNCENTINTINSQKKALEAERNNALEKLDKAIKEDERLLEYLAGLIAGGENYEQEYNAVESRIKDNNKKKDKIKDDYSKKLLELDNQIRQKTAEKDKLEAELNSL